MYCILTPIRITNLIYRIGLLCGFIYVNPNNEYGKSSEPKNELEI
jgi:hypothetical protein